MSCIEVTVLSTSEAVDWVCTLLASTNYTTDISVNKYTSTNDGHQNNWTHTINFYLPNNTQANSRIQEIENLLSPLHRTALTSTLEAYVIAEKPNKSDIIDEPIQISEKFTVLNSDTVYLPNTSNQIIIKLKTSLAFGSGLHPATILAIKLLERYITNNMNILDLGCGSGILSVAAAKLGANVLALDNDAVAVEATRDAITRNDVTNKVQVVQGSLGRGSKMGNWMGGANTGNVSSISPNGNFDLIVANILGRIHTTLAPEYQQALHKSGILITSGYDKDYEESVTKAFSAQGFEAIDCERFNEWVALTHKKT